MLNDKQCRSWLVGFFRSQLIWIYTVFKGRVCPGSAGQVLIFRKKIVQSAKTDRKLWIFQIRHFFLLLSKFQWDYWQKNEQISQNIIRKVLCSCWRMHSMKMQISLYVCVTSDQSVGHNQGYKTLVRLVKFCKQFGTNVEMTRLNFSELWITILIHL